MLEPLVLGGKILRGFARCRGSQRGWLLGKLATVVNLGVNWLEELMIVKILFNFRITLTPVFCFSIYKYQQIKVKKQPNLAKAHAVTHTYHTYTEHETSFYNNL